MKRAIAIIALLMMSGCSSIPQEIVKNELKPEVVKSTAPAKLGLGAWDRKTVKQIAEADVWVDGHTVKSRAGMYVRFIDLEPGEHTYGARATGYVTVEAKAWLNPGDDFVYTIPMEREGK